MNQNNRTISALQATTFPYTQAEYENLSYTINYASILQSDTISTSTWAENGATITNPASTDTTATAMLTASPGRHRVTNTITTAAGETYQRTILLSVTSDTTAIGDYE